MPDDCRVYIAQCLCGPNRHSILAGAREIDESGADGLLGDLRERIDTLIAGRGINHWCGICLSERANWRFEVTPTDYPSIEAAAADLAAAQAENIAASLIFGSHGAKQTRH